MFTILTEIPNDLSENIQIETTPFVIIHGFDEKGSVCYIIIEHYERLGFLLHLDVKRFGPSTLKIMKNEWPIIRECLSDMGVNKLVTTYILNDYKKWGKFIKHFGFKEPVRVMYTEEI